MRISDEWLVGATAGAYAVLTFVLYFWGSAFVHYWCGSSPYRLYTPDGNPGVLILLFPGLLVCIADWLQIKCSQMHFALLAEPYVRTALWINLIGVSGFFVAVASNYGPDRNSAFFAIVSLLGMAFWPLGLLLSVGNLLWACIRWARAPHSARPSA